MVACKQKVFFFSLLLKLVYKTKYISSIWLFFALEFAIEKLILKNKAIVCFNCLMEKVFTVYYKRG